MIDTIATLYQTYPAAVCGAALLIGVPVVLLVFAADWMGRYGER